MKILRRVRQYSTFMNNWSFSEVSEPKHMVVLVPKRQHVWGWPAVTNFTLCGAACGFYLFYALMIYLGKIPPGLARPGALKLLSPALVVIGFATLIMEAGRPSRGYYLLQGLRSSWMSWEVLIGAIFIVTAFADVLFRSPILQGVAVVAATVLVASQGFIVYRSRAVTSWNLFIVPLLFLTSGLSTGVGLALLTLFHVGDLGFFVLMAGLACIVLDLAVWIIFLRLSGRSAYLRATAPLRRPLSLFATVVLGHVVPMFLMSLVILLSSKGSSDEKIFPQVISVIAGAAVIVGGVSQKAGIILRAGYLRGIVMAQEKSNPE
jgi:DMSO reductase anchor subunit